MKKNLLGKLAGMALAILMITTNAYALIDCNGVGDGYTNRPGKKAGENNAVEKIVIEAAGHFLKAQSEMLHFCKLYELQDRGIDYDQWQTSLEKTTRHIQNAKESYLKLVTTAKNTPYNRLTVSSLKAFAYDSFMEEHRLNSDVFQRVEALLSAGNIDGIFVSVLKIIVQIEKLLQQISDAAAAGTVPELSTVWRINQFFTENHLFGQYVARVFFKLRSAGHTGNLEKIQ